MPERQLIRLYFRNGVTIDTSIDEGSLQCVDGLLYWSTDEKWEDALQWLNHGELLAVTCRPAPAEADHA